MPFCKVPKVNSELLSVRMTGSASTFSTCAPYSRGSSGFDELLLHIAVIISVFLNAHVAATRKREGARRGVGRGGGEFAGIASAS